MSFFPRRHSKQEHEYNYLRLFAFVTILVLPWAILGQGSGRSSEGTNGGHVITGYVFFPSGPRADGNIQVRLQSFQRGRALRNCR
jgi:hypothetical protein